jgi:hypothetical protein
MTLYWKGEQEVMRRGGKWGGIDAGLEVSAFERDMALKVTIVLEGDREVGLPLVGVSAVEKEIHELTRAIKGGR